MPKLDNGHVHVLVEKVILLFLWAHTKLRHIPSIWSKGKPFSSIRHIDHDLYVLLKHKLGMASLSKMHYEKIHYEKKHDKNMRSGIPVPNFEKWPDAVIFWIRDSPGGSLERPELDLSGSIEKSKTG